ncbi:hypothetical protein ASC74_16350 [Pseudomonas sp. Root329]|uniref:hypothetical protein n=1 Tax=Pseudomonas sp. Root329 TaxID=1736515 RepID=UPI0006FFC5A4|nr:hypothetical protein [Pseudomonas sp. Root329]KQV21974.1 hypothetical protein ASC74_16350 [Pseudomonas sp. Root329]
MSFAARAYPTTLSAQAYLSATINGDSNPNFKHVKTPAFKEFRSTSIPSIELKDFPDGQHYWLRAGHTENGMTQTIEFVFYKKPATGTSSISKDIEDVRVTYNSNPVNGDLHVADSGSITFQYDDIEKTLTATWNGLFDHGGADGNSLFPINGELLVNADLSQSRK